MKDAWNLAKENLKKNVLKPDSKRKPIKVKIGSKRPCLEKIYLINKQILYAFQKIYFKISKKNSKTIKMKGKNKIFKVEKKIQISHISWFDQWASKKGKISKRNQNKTKQSLINYVENWTNGSTTP